MNKIDKIVETIQHSRREEDYKCPDLGDYDGWITKGNSIPILHYLFSHSSNPASHMVDDEIATGVSLILGE